MASTIQIKRGTGSAVPSGLADGELAINLDNRRLYFGSGSTSVNDFSFGEITAEKYIVSSSVLYVTTSFSSGSTEFGDTTDDTHTFIGNITASGNISSSGTITGNSIAGTLSTAAQTNITSVGTLTNLVVDNVQIDSNAINSTSDTDVFISMGTAGFGFEANNGDLFNFNSAQNNVDFQYNGENDSNLLYIDASADKVGIGVSTPGEKLTVAGNISASGNVITNNITASGNISASGAITTIGLIKTNGNITGTNLLIDTIELGHASIGDTTIARSAAGQITVENKVVLLEGAQTGITTIFKEDLKIGEDTQTAIDFETANEIHFDADNAEVMNLNTLGINLTGAITASGNISSSGAIIGNIGTFNDLGHITSSGNISSSGTVKAGILQASSLAVDLGIFGTLTTSGDADILGNIELGDQNDTTIARSAAGAITVEGVPVLLQGLDTLVGHITSSGNISASGIITAEGLTITDDAFITDDLIVTGDISCNNFSLAGVISHVGNTDTKITFGHSDSITFSAGGTDLLILSEGTTDTIALGAAISTHITASGNVSASGTIIASNLSGTNTGDQDLSSYSTITQLNASSSTLQTNIDAKAPIANPSFTGPLHVSASGESKFDLVDTGGQTYRLFARNSDDVFGIYDVTQTRTWFRYTGNATIGNTKLALLEGGGKVGIGNTSPPEVLTVEGNISASGTITAATLDVNSGDTNVAINATSTDADCMVRVQDNSTAGTNAIGMVATGDDLVMRNDEGNFKIKMANNATTTLDLNQNGDLSLTGHITATGNVSASGHVRGDRIYAGTLIFGSSPSTDKIRVGYDSSVQFLEYGKNATTSHFFEGNITASGNISSSANIYVDRYYANEQFALGNLNGAVTLGYDNTYPINIGKSTNPIKLFGNVTSSGNISSSGDIFSNNLYINGYNVANSTGTTLRLGYDTSLATITYGSALGDTSNFFYGNITASGNISSSGEIEANTLDVASTSNFADDITLGDTKKLKGVRLTISASNSNNIYGTSTFHQDVNLNGGVSATNITSTNITSSGEMTAADLFLDGGLNNGTPILSFSSSQLPQGGISYYDSGNFPRYAFFFPEPDVVSIANRASNGTVQIRANNSTAGGGGEVTSSIFTSFSNEFLHPVTASGNISASLNSKLYASSASFGGAAFLRSFNVKGAGLDGRLSLQGASTNDNPGIEMTVNDNTSRVLMRLNPVGSNGTELAIFTEPDGGSIAEAITVESDGNLELNSHDIKGANKLVVDGGQDEVLKLNTTSATGNPFIDFSQNGSRKSFIQHNDTDDTLKIASEFGAISFQTATDGNQIERMSISSGGATTFTGDISASGTITADRFVGSQLTMVPFNFYASSVHSSELYVPQGGSQIESTSDQPYHFMLAPYDGKVRRVSVYYQTGDPGNLTARVRAAAAPFDLDDSADIVQAETISSAVDDTAYFFDFSASFSKGEAVALTFEAASHGSNSYVVGCMAVEYDTTT